MAKLKSLRLKEKVFIFKSYGNDRDANPAKIVFNRFPIGGETFARVDKKGIFDGVDMEKMSDKGEREKAADNMVSNYVSNIMSGNVDYARFFEECVERLEDFEYGGSNISTPDDFWRLLPHDAADVIAGEAYRHAMVKDEFTMGELTA